MDEATGAASLILFLALLAIEIVMYGFGRAIQSLNSGKIQEMAEAGNKGRNRSRGSWISLWIISIRSRRLLF